MRLALLGAALAGLLAAALPARAAIDIEPVTSPGGIHAWLYTDPTIPIVTIEASFEGGALLDPAGKEGAVALMTALLDEGAGSRDATAYAEARDALAARIGFSSGRESVTLSATMLSENRDATVELLRDALLEPRFDAEPFARVQAQMLAGLQADRTNPNAIAGRAFRERLFEGHAYARAPDGTAESVAMLAPEDVREARRQALGRDGMTVSVVGDITAEELGPLLDRLFGDLPAGGAADPGAAAVGADGSLTVIPFDIPQSVVLFGHEGIARDDPDFIPAFVMNHILGGGGFGSRLTDELREARGLTYGVYSALVPYDHAALVTGRFSSANDRVAEAIGLVRAEWRRMAEEGVSAAELEAAKRYLTGAYPLRFDSNGAIAGQLGALQEAGLDREYVNLRNDLVEAVTLEDVRRVAARLLDPDALTFVVVGQPEGLEPVN